MTDHVPFSDVFRVSYSGQLIGTGKYITLFRRFTVWNWTACIQTNRREYVNSKLTHLHQTYFVREFTVSVQFMSWIYTQTSGFDNLSSVTSFLKY